MRALAASLLICLLLGASTATSTPRRESCSCTADDGSCSASITCPAGKGCIAVCPSNNCRAVCVKSAGVAEVNPLPKSPFPTDGEERDRTTAEAAHRTDTETLLNQVRPHYAPGQKVQNNFPGDADVRTLRGALMSSEKMSMCFRGVTAGSLTGELSSLTGLNIKVEAGDAGAIINYSVKGVTFSEMLVLLSKQSGVRFSVKQ